MGKEILFPVLNAEFSPECLCPVGCPDCSPKPLPSFPFHYLKDVRATVAHIMLCILLCYNLPMVKEFPFSDVSSSCIEAVKNIWSLNSGWDEAILNLFCPVLFFVPSNHSLQSSLEIWRLRPMSSWPLVLTYTLRSLKRFLGDKIQLISSVRAFPCSTGSKDISHFV